MRTGHGIQFHVLGRGDEAILLHPSLGVGRFLFHRLIPVWAREYTVVSWDPRGVGDHRHREPSMEAFVGDTEEILEAVDRPCHLVGVSLGALVMARVAVTDDPRIVSLTLAGATLGFTHGREILAERARTLPELGMAAFAAQYVEETLTRWAQAEVRENLRLEMADQTVGHYLAAARAVYLLDHRSVISRIRRPTLVVVGTEDRRTPPREAEQVVRAIPHSRLEVILRAGHLSPLDQPGRFDEAVRPFWREVSAKHG